MNGYMIEHLGRKFKKNSYYKSYIGATDFLVYKSGIRCIIENTDSIIHSVSFNNYCKHRCSPESEFITYVSDVYYNGVISAKKLEKIIIKNWNDTENKDKLELCRSKYLIRPTDEITYEILNPGFLAMTYLRNPNIDNNMIDIIFKSHNIGSHLYGYYLKHNRNFEVIWPYWYQGYFNESEKINIIKNAYCIPKDLIKSTWRTESLEVKKEFIINRKELEINDITDLLITDESIDIRNIELSNRFIDLSMKGF